MNSELVRFAHILIAACMLSEAIHRVQGHAKTAPLSPATGIEINQAERAVWIDGARITLSGQSYDLLVYLHQHANQLCTRQDLIEQVFDMIYDDTNRSHITRLNTAIARLREKIEIDSSHPRYLQTEPGGGYRLVLPS